MIQTFWHSLSEEEKLRAETEALTQATPLERNLLARGGSGGAAARKAALDAYVWERLQAAR